MQYFISDTHFGHKNVLKMERDRFSTIEAHDDFIMRRIESTVKTGDELYFLGDFALGKPNPEIISRFKKLPCKKIAIKGNHDKTTLLEEVFDEVHQYPIFISNRILLSHEPEMVSPYVLNVHGHLHSSYLDSPNHLNVNIAMTNYSLYSMRVLNQYLSRLPEKVDAFLYEWYADKYVYMKRRDDLSLDEYGKINVEETKKIHSERFVERTFYTEDDQEIALKVQCKFKRDNEQIWLDEEGKYWITKNDPETRKRIIEECEVIEEKAGTYKPGIEKWNRCHLNGKAISNLFPKASKEEKYAYLFVQRKYC